MGLLSDTYYCGLRMHRECLGRIPRYRGWAIPTCITSHAWCMPGSLTSGFLLIRWGGNVPGIPGACATRNFTYLARGPLQTFFTQMQLWYINDILFQEGQHMSSSVTIPIRCQSASVLMMSALCGHLCSVTTNLRLAYRFSPTHTRGICEQSFCHRETTCLIGLSVYMWLEVKQLVHRLLGWESSYTRHAIMLITIVPMVLPVWWWRSTYMVASLCVKHVVGIMGAGISASLSFGGNQMTEWTGRFARYGCLIRKSTCHRGSREENEVHENNIDDLEKYLISS